MNRLRIYCWCIIVGGFAFGLSDRWLAADLSSMGIALCFALLIVPLCPLIKEQNERK